MTNQSLISKSNYVSERNYITGTIRELDIKAANINILFHSGLIDENLYQYLLALPKQDREIYIGNRIRQDKGIYESIQNGIKEAKIWLSEANNLKDSEIVRIANDAVYVKRTSPLGFLKYDNIEFVEKNVYSSMLNLNGIVLFFNYNKEGVLNVDVKGIGDKELGYHNGYILSIIGQTIFLLERSSSRDAMKFISDFYDQFINRVLPIGMYRPFDATSAYQIYGFLCYDEPDNVQDVDIRYNLNVIRTLYGVVLEEYMKGK